MSRYEWPPLPVLDPDEATRRMADAIAQAFGDLEEERYRVEVSLTMGRKRLVDEALEEFQEALIQFDIDMAHHLDRFATLHLGPRYMAGVLNGGGSPVWTSIHIDAFTSLALDTYGDFLRRSEEAGKTARDFAKVVRRVARRELPKIAGGGRTAAYAAQNMIEELILNYDITHVFYRNGARVPIHEYARMAARTKSAVAYNVGTLREFRAAGGSFVEVFDGSDCGWSSHGSPDKANGTFRHVDDADANLIAHPNCQRAFGPRPDLRTKADAKAAQQSTTPEQRADQKEIDWTPARGRARQQARARREARRNRRAGM